MSKNELIVRKFIRNYVYERSVWWELLSEETNENVNSDAILTTIIENEIFLLVENCAF